MRALNLYLICSNDYLQTAFFCGTACECTDVLQLKNINTFYSLLSKKAHVWGGFAHIERVRI